MPFLASHMSHRASPSLLSPLPSHHPPTRPPILIPIPQTKHTRNKDLHVGAGLVLAVLALAQEGVDLVDEHDRRLHLRAEQDGKS
eukprot:1012165-Rhodomonas_salina.1